MRFYHVRITVQGEPHDEVKVDIDAETLERQILQPYRSGAPITINGKTIEVGTLQRVRVATSDEPSAQIIERLRAEDRASSGVFIGGPGYEWRAAARATDVTDQFITGPAGSDRLTGETSDVERRTAGELSAAHQERGSRGDAGTVFVVAGRDSKAIAAIVELLRALGLRIVEWEQAVAKTGLPNPYVGDVVEAGLRMAGAAVVILTPDDLVQLRSDLLQDDDGPHERETRGQARPNVYYEAGIADTLGRDRTIIIEIGSVKSFSDALGRHVVRYDGSPPMRNTLAQRLQVAGLDVDQGGSHWLTAGDIAPAMEAASNELASGSLDRKTPVVDRANLVRDLDALDQLYTTLQEESQYDDFSDSPQASLQYVVRAQALVDRSASGTTYMAETDAVRGMGPHLRIPVLRAVLESMRTEAEAIR